MTGLTGGGRVALGREAGVMTGPEHYREAERLLAEGPAGWSEAVRISLAAAQVHATLALAAATAAGQAAAYDGDETGSRSAAGRGKP